MATGLSIRLASINDTAAVRRCAQEAYARYVEAIGKKPVPMTADFPSLIRNGFVYVAVDQTGAIAGYIVFFQEDDHVMLENVAVLPAASGRGLGKRLIAFCEAEAKRAGAVKVKLYTNEKMTGNLSIYPHLGYRETVRKHEDGFDRIYFEKLL